MTIEKNKITLFVFNYQKQLAVLAAITLITVFLYIYYKTSPTPFRVIVGNRESKSFSAAFITYEPAKTCVMVRESKWFSKLEFKCDQQKTTIHKLDFNQKTPDTNYKIYYFSGLKTNLFKPLTVHTKPVSQTTPSLPEPGYGSVIRNDLETIPHSLVLVYTETGLEDSLIAITNDQGNYSVDLSTIYHLGENIYLESSTADGLWGGVKSKKNIHTPFPPIEVKGIAELE